MASGGKPKDVWAGHGSVLTINSSGQFVGVSLNSGRAGVKPPLDAINLTQSVDKGACNNSNALKFVPITVCGGTTGERVLSTPTARAKIRTNSIEIIQDGEKMRISDGETVDVPSDGSSEIIRTNMVTGTGSDKEACNVQ